MISYSRLMPLLIPALPGAYFTARITDLCASIRYGYYPLYQLRLIIAPQAVRIMIVPILRQVLNAQRIMDLFGLVRSPHLLHASDTVVMVWIAALLSALLVIHSKQLREQRTIRRSFVSGEDPAVEAFRTGSEDT